jgi:hypothetical protein
MSTIQCCDCFVIDLIVRRPFRPSRDRNEHHKEHLTPFFCESPEFFFRPKTVGSFRLVNGFSPAGFVRSTRLAFKEVLMPGSDADLRQAGLRNDATRKYNSNVDYDFVNLPCTDLVQGLSVFFRPAQHICAKLPLAENQMIKCKKSRFSGRWVNDMILQIIFMMTDSIMILIQTYLSSLLIV